MKEVFEGAGRRGKGGRRKSEEEERYEEEDFRRGCLGEE